MYDVIIIGAGISGLTSAIYLKRYGLNVLLLERNVPGGVLNTIPLIENYPGIESVDGATIAYNAYTHVKNLGIEVKKCEVLELVNNKERKEIITNKGNLSAKYVVIATGRIPRRLGIENEDKLIGKGISYCATCDGALYKDRDVIVVGGGNSALIEAKYLSDICKSVTILVRNNTLRADKIYIEQLNNNIKILYNKQINKLNIKNDELTSVTLKDGKIIDTSCVFVFIGNDPSTNFINKLNLTDNNGYIIVDNNMKTKIDGIYAVGDVINKELYQIVTAESDGAIAAYNIKKEFTN